MEKFNTIEVCIVCKYLGHYFPRYSTRRPEILYQPRFECCETQDCSDVRMQRTCKQVLINRHVCNDQPDQLVVHSEHSIVLFVQESTHWFQPLKVYSRQLSSTKVMPATLMMPVGRYNWPAGVLLAACDIGGDTIGGHSPDGAAADIRTSA